MQQLLQQKNPVKAPDMQQLLLGDKRMPQRFADDDTAAEHWKVMPHIKKKDYLLQYTKAKDRKWTPRRGTANTGDEQQTNFDPKDMDMLCKKCRKILGLVAIMFYYEYYYYHY